MSKTDKTRPGWMVLLDPPRGVRIRVNHWCHKLHQECDLGVYMGLPRSTGHRFCTIWGAYGDNDKVYGRVPKRSARKALGFEGRNRMLLRQLRKTWRFTDPEDIDSREYAPTRAAYVYNRWNWD